MINWKRWNKLCKPFRENINKRIKVEIWWINPESANGDLPYNTARMHIETDDQSQWANDSLEGIFSMLDSGKRWPDHMWDEGYVTTTNHTQDQVTRDCWIMAVCDAVHLNRYDLIKESQPPFKAGPYREWYKALIGEKNFFGEWRWLPLVIFVNHTYVFWGFMEKAYQKVKESGI